MRGSTNAQKAETDLTSVNSAITSLQNGKQNKLTFDTVPVSGSSNPITSGAVYTALEDVGGSGFTQTANVYPITLLAESYTVELLGIRSAYSSAMGEQVYVPRTITATKPTGTITLTADGCTTYQSNVTIKSDSTSYVGQPSGYGGGYGVDFYEYSGGLRYNVVFPSSNISTYVGGKKSGVIEIKGNLIGTGMAYSAVVPIFTKTLNVTDGNMAGFDIVISFTESRAAETKTGNYGTYPQCNEPDNLSLVIYSMNFTPS